MKFTKIKIPYGEKHLTAKVPENSILFDGKSPNIEPVGDLGQLIEEGLAMPVNCPALGEMLSMVGTVLILIEDNTRFTPVERILPILVDYLINSGIKSSDIEILVATGTHRVMTDEELLLKVGKAIYDRIKISQHDFEDLESLEDLGFVEVESSKIPVQVNKKAIEADFIIGIGNIVPHCDAGYSAGAKILQPGICGYPTIAATHIAAALLGEIPLGDVNNPCRAGMEKVAAKVGLKFIINTIMNTQDEVVDVVCGDFIQAHRQGVEVAKIIFGVSVPEPADIVIVSSYPADLDYWQAGKAIIAAYFAVKKDGIIILASPCPEGLENNHPRFAQWLQQPFDQSCHIARQISPDDREADLVAADVAICHARSREKISSIFSISEGLTPEFCDILGFTRFNTLQAAVNTALKHKSNGTIGILPRGGDCLPIVD